METLYTGRVHGFPNVTSAIGVYGPPSGADGVLSLVVVLTTSVSLVALVFAFITYSLFSDLKNLNGTTLMTLLAAIFMTQLIYVIGVGGVQDRELCLGLGSGLTYLRGSVLCLSWAVASPLDLPSSALWTRFALLSATAWGLPAFSTAAALYISQTPLPKHQLDCWFLDARAFTLAYFLPGLFVLGMSLFGLKRERERAVYAARTRGKLEPGRGAAARGRLSASLLAVVFGVDLLLAGAARLRPSQPSWALYSVAHASQGLVAALCVTSDRRLLRAYSRPRRAPSSPLLPPGSPVWTPPPDPI